MKKNTQILLFTVAIAYSSLLFSQQKENNTIKIFNQELTIENQKSIENSGYIRCGATEYERALQAKNSKRATIEAFESWLAPKVLEKKAQLLNRNAKVVQTIPIVFHILTDGTGSENLTEAQIQAQVDQLNIDFGNLDSSPHTAAADTEIQFCLALQDPTAANMIEPGINRITTYGDTSQTPATMEGGIKQATSWDPTRYMNIWVSNLGNGLLGYAQFPSASGLSGFDTDEGDADTDGVVVLHSAIGSEANPNPAGGSYASGRTLTHEIGHWIGLRHTWGDTTTCTNDDYCADTPDGTGSNFGCVTVDSCPNDGLGNDMSENYMDYSDDTCMNTFTNDQKTRILTVMSVSPRRMELPNSTACQAVAILSLDGRVDIDNLNLIDCGDSITPDITITNRGSNMLTSATIEYYLDSETPIVYNWTGLLAYQESDTFSIPTIYVADGSHTFNAELLNPNGGTDLQTNDNADTSDAFAAYYDTTTVNLILIPDDYGSETTWSFKDSANTVLYSGGPYTDNDSTPENETFTVVIGECYTFTINDSYGDGICCSFGNGSYELLTGANVSIVSGGNFTSQENVSVGINQLSVNEFELSRISIFPNPTSNTLNIKGLETALKSIEIYSITGQRVMSTTTNLETVNVGDIANGVYFLKLNTENATKTLKFIKE